MRGKLARSIRKKVYGVDGTHLVRKNKYTHGRKTITVVDRDADGKKMRKKGKVVTVEKSRRYAILSAGDLRNEYQEMKKFKSGRIKCYM